MLPSEANKIVEQLCLLQSENDNISINSILPILNQIPYPIHILDAKATVISCNNSYKSIFGNIFDNKNPNRTFIVDGKEQKRECSTEKISEDKFLYKLGNIQNDKGTYNIASFKIIDKEGKATNYIEIVYNIYQSELHEFSLNDAIIQYKALINTLPIGIFKVAKDGVFSYANSYFIELLGLESYDELIKYNIVDFLLNRDITNKIRESIKQSTLDSWTFNDTFKDIKGNTIYATSKVNVFKDDNDNALYYEVVVKDIKSPMHSIHINNILPKIYEDNNSSLQELLNVMCKELMTVFHAKRSLLTLYDFDEDRYTAYYKCFNNEPCTDYSQVNLDLSNTLLDYVRQFERIMQVDSELKIELQNAGKIKEDGTPFDKWIGIPLINSRNLAIGIISIECRDDYFFDKDLLDSINLITKALGIIIENKQASAIIKSQSEKYRDIFDGVDEGILYVDKTGTILDANWQFLKMGNVLREQVIGHNASLVAKHIIHPEDVKILLKVIVENLQGKPTTERIILRDVQSNIYEFYTFTNENKQGITGVIRDITKEEKLKTQLRKAKERAEEVSRMKTALLNIHQSSYQVIGTEDLIIALCGELETVIPRFKFGVMHYAYYNKKYVSSNYLSKTNSLEQTESLINYVRKTKKTLFLNKNDMTKLFKDKVLTGHKPEVNYWMAYPILDSDYNIIAIIEASSQEENIPVEKYSDNFLLLAKGIGITLSNKISQTELEQSEIQYLNIFEGVRDGIVYLGKDGIIINVNDSFCKMVLMSKDKLVGRHVSDIAKSQIDKDASLESYLKTVSNSVEGRETKKVVFHNIRGDVFEGSIYTDKFQPGITALFRDITQETAFKSELIEARRQAEEGQRLKTAFLSNISHEIRTPMNGILGFSSILLREQVSTEKQTQFLKIIFDSTKQLLSILNDILDISKIEAGKISFKLSTFDLNEMMTDLYNKYKAEIEEKGLDVKLKKIVADETYSKLIATDQEKVKQVLSYILDNALKFTDEGEIKFGYFCASSVITFFVEDTGIGISESIQEVIFDRFKQIEHSYGGRIINAGLGLGLSIAKEYVNIMGGNIWVESEEKKGSKFMFKIPCHFVNK